MKQEEPIKNEEQRSPRNELSLLSDRVASMNLRSAATNGASVQLNNNAFNQFNYGTNAMFAFNPRIGSRFNDAFTPATHQQGAFGFGFGSLDAFYHASNPLQFDSVPLFPPIVFGRDIAAGFGLAPSASCSNGLNRENDAKMNWPAVKLGMFFLFKI